MKSPSRLIPCRTTLCATALLQESAVGLALACLLILTGCPAGRAPRTPTAGGPVFGRPGDSLRFWARSTDPAGDDISYFFGWSDAVLWGWTPELASGDTFFRIRVYPETGSYELRVKARNRKGLESDWSLPLRIAVRFEGPYIAGRIAGPREVREDTAVWFSVTPGHVRQESASVQFHWGDTTGAWSGFGTPGRPIPDTHTFTNPGPVMVRARARDRTGNTSPWSLPETVLVLRRALHPPKNLTLRASTGTSVRLRWETGFNPESVFYRLWFEPLGARFSRVDSTVNYWYVHDPMGATGRYTVSARRDAEEAFASETLSTVPILTETTLLYELNADGDAGYGWNTGTGIGRTLDMKDSTTAGAADAYFTDLSPGSNGPSYYLASPHMGVEDPGGAVPPAAWRKTWFLPIFGNMQWPLPGYDPSLYHPVVNVDILESFYSVYTQNGYYALVKNVGHDPERGTLRIRSWFQRIRGLRLIQHEETRR